MRLESIDITQFKNYSSAKVSFNKKVNLIYGDNGSGKTNFLDAIHFLCVSKSYFGMSDKNLVQQGESFYRLIGNFSKRSKSETLSYKYAIGGRRTIQRNLEKIKRVSDLIGHFPVVLIAPDDINIVKGASKNRRDYFNKWICQSDSEYLDQLLVYNRLMRQKDALLKGDRSPSPLAIEAFNAKLMPLAESLNQKLNTVLKPFTVELYRQYELISSGKDRISLSYISDFNHQDAASLFERSLSDEIRYKRPLVGIQKDDFEFKINDYPLKKYGSQGQIKSVLYSLRLAEYNYLFDVIEDKPILILDDYFEKLDHHRLSSLLNLLSKDQIGQVFLSDTELERSRAIFNERNIEFDSFKVTGEGIQAD